MPAAIPPSPLSRMRIYTAEEVHDAMRVYGYDPDDVSARPWGALTLREIVRRAGIAPIRFVDTPGDITVTLEDVGGQILVVNLETARNLFLTPTLPVGATFDILYFNPTEGLTEMSITPVAVGAETLTVLSVDGSSAVVSNNGNVTFRKVRESEGVHYWNRRADAVGGGAAAGTVRILTDADGEAGGVIAFRALESDLGGTIEIRSTDEFDPDRVLIIPAGEVGDRLTVRFSTNILAPVVSTNTVGIGGRPWRPWGGVFILVLDVLGEYEYDGVPFGGTVEILKLEAMEIPPEQGGPSTAHIWVVVSSHGGTAGGGGGGSRIESPDASTYIQAEDGGIVQTAGIGRLSQYSFPWRGLGLDASGVMGTYALDERPWIVGNAVTGHTLAECDFLDTGDGEAIYNAVQAVKNSGGARRRIKILRGGYDFSKFSSPALPINVAYYSFVADPPEIFMEADEWGSVFFFVGAERWLFDTNNAEQLFYSSFLHITGITIQLTDDVVSGHSGERVIGQSTNGGYVYLTRCNLITPYYNNAPSTAETLRAFVECGGGIVLEDVQMNANGYANGLAGGTEFVCFRCPNGNVEAKTSILTGGDGVIEAGAFVILDDCDVGSIYCDGALPAITSTYRVETKNGTQIYSQGVGSFCAEAPVFVMANTDLFSKAGNTAALLRATARAGLDFLRVGFYPAAAAPALVVDAAGTTTGMTLESCTFGPNCAERMRGLFLLADAHAAVKDRVPMRGIRLAAASSQNGVAGTLRGETAGFIAHALIRMDTIPTGFEIIFGNNNLYQTDGGGWYLGLDALAFRFGIGQLATGDTANSGGAGLQSYSTFFGRLIGRTFLLTLSYRSGIAYLYINGELVQQITPSGGLGRANVAHTPYVGRNTNAGVPAHCVSPTIMGVAYGGVHTHANVEAYFMEVVRKNRLVDASYLTNVWIPEDVTFTNRPMVTKKGADALTLVGTQTAAEFEPTW